MRFSGGMAVLLLFLLAAAVGMGYYVFRALRRTAGNLHLRTDTKPRKALLIALAVFITLCSLNLFSMSGVILLHFLFFSMLTDLIVLCLQRLCKNGLPKTLGMVHKALLVPVLATSVLMGIGYWNMQNVSQTAVTIETDKAIRSEGYRVALIADLHFGVSIDEVELQAVCDELSAQDLDALFLAGDITDESTTKAQMQALYKAFGSVETSLGTYFSYGNHDRQRYSQHSKYTTDELVDAIEQNGITILCDSAVAVADDLVIAGREDLSMERTAPRKSVENLFADADPTDYWLVLDHQPQDYEENIRAGTDLLLSGHTHAGQFWPVNWLLAIFGINDNDYGLVETDGFAGFVTAGIAGWKYPIKTAAPAEYVMIDILPAAN